MLSTYRKGRYLYRTDEHNAVMLLRQEFTGYWLIWALILPYYVDSWIHFVRIGNRHWTNEHSALGTARTRLYSFGDPDLSPKSVGLRKWQQLCRFYDSLFYQDEVDCPGLSFPSPIEWAPWMETVWFGNYYDYRTAYFQDVMYSNNREGREGALLVPFPSTDAPKKRKRVKSSEYPIAVDLALLYQRYNKFSQESYSISNLTYFNVFGAESIRIGRYKIPQTPELLLCVTDPLTVSDMKRYLTSFNILKWFKSKYLQQKRKRQWLLSYSESTHVSYFSQMVYLLEYYRIVEYLTLHPVDHSSPIIGTSNRERFLSTLLSLLTFQNKNTFDNALMKWSLQVSVEYRVPKRVIPVLSAPLPLELVHFIFPESNYLPYRTMNALQVYHSLESDSSDAKEPGNTSSSSFTTESREFARNLSTEDDVEGFVLPVSLVNSQYIMEVLFQGLVDQINSRMREIGQVFDPTEWEVVIGGDQRLFNNYAMEVAIRILLGNGLASLKLTEQVIYSMGLARGYYKNYLQNLIEGKKVPKYSLSLIFSGKLSRSGINHDFGLQILQYNVEDNEMMFWQLKDFYELFRRFETTKFVTIYSNALNSEALNYLNQPMSNNLTKMPFKDQIRGLTYHQYLLPIIGVIPDWREVIPELSTIRNFLILRNVSIVIDGSYGIFREILNRRSLSRHDDGQSFAEALGINLSDCYVNNDYLEDPLVADDQTFPLLDPGRNLYYQLYIEKSVHIEETIMGELFGLTSKEVTPTLRTDDCPALGFSISPDASDCRVIIAGRVLPTRSEVLQDPISTIIHTLYAAASYFAKYPEKKITPDTVLRILDKR